MISETPLIYALDKNKSIELLNFEFKYKIIIFHFYIKSK